MAKYDMNQCVLSLNGYAITEFDESGDSVSFAPSADAGEYVIGASGSGVFVASGNNSGTMTIKLLQHTEDNKVLNQLMNHQTNSLKTFTPIEMFFKDTMNNDEVIGHRGFFTVKPTITRGITHNSITWTIVFEELLPNLDKGALN